MSRRLVFLALAALVPASSTRAESKEDLSVREILDRAIEIASFFAGFTCAKGSSGDGSPNGR